MERRANIDVGTFPGARGEGYREFPAASGVGEQTIRIIRRRETIVDIDAFPGARGEGDREFPMSQYLVREGRATRNSGGHVPP